MSGEVKQMILVEPADVRFGLFAQIMAALLFAVEEVTELFEVIRFPASDRGTRELFGNRNAGAHQFLQFREMMLVNIARENVLFRTDLRRHRDDFPEVPERAHHPCRGKCHVRQTDQPSSEKQIPDSVCVQTAVWNRIERRQAPVIGAGAERFGKTIQILRFRIVQVD